MKKKMLIAFVATVCLMMAIAPVLAQGGFNEYGFNYNARIFVGVGENWYRGKYGLPVWHEGDPFLWDETYGRDHLVMKWSKAWDDARFHGADWTPEAWCTNEWNGMFPGGSGETWHYTNVWIGYHGLPNYTPLPDGGQAIWGSFEIILSHGTITGEHVWDAHAIPSGMHPAL